MNRDRVVGFDLAAPGGDRSVFTIATRAEDGTVIFEPINLIDVKLTFSSPPCELIAKPPMMGARTITGTITPAASTREALDRFLNTHRNKVLRMARPHMPRRMFYRLRGKMKADRRREGR